MSHGGFPDFIDSIDIDTSYFMMGPSFKTVNQPASMAGMDYAPFARELQTKTPFS